jgi:demethylmenaquinone methyltransferase/2-methoxy-6-polyprenyl-1,4-benzoquinol methylase
MKDKSKREFFDREAHGWNDRFHQTDEPEIRRLVERFDLRPDDRVLDLGTGNGILLRHISQRVSGSGEVLALDFSWKMISEAARIEGRAHVRFINASAEALPLKDRTVDCITCLATFAHLCDKKEAIEEMSRVLRSDGRLYIAHLLSSKELEEHHRSAGGAVEHDVLPSDAQMAAMLQKAGLRDILVVDQPNLYLASAKR